MSNIRFDTNASAPGTPPAGELALYAKNDDRLYHKNDAGVETVLATAGVVGGDNVVYLETAANGGSDGTGTRGDPSKPYATLKTALANCLDGDVLRIGAGTFTIADAADVPAWPAGVNRLVIEGAGAGFSLLASPGGTRITSGAGTSAGTHIFDLVTTAVHVVFRNLFIEVTASTGRPIRAVGASTTFLQAGLFIDNCIVQAPSGQVSAEIIYANLVFLNHVLSLQSGKFVFNTSNVYDALGCVLGAVDFTYDDTHANKPAITRLTSVFRASTLDGALVLSKEVDIRLKDVRVSGSISSSGITGASAPKFRFDNIQTPQIDFLTSTLPNVAGMVFELLNSYISGTGGNALRLKLAADANTLEALARNSTFEGAVTIDEDVNLTMRACSYVPSSTTTAGTGTITPDYWPCTVALDAATPAPVTFGITAASAPSRILLTAQGPGLGDFYPTALTPTGFDLNWTGAAVAGNVHVLAQWDL